MKLAYYNEIDPFAAAWLRELIAAGHLPAGVVDERDIRDIVPTELEIFTQHHFFAGIGGWPYALRLAGWPDDRPVWTGSCPCQPFSSAGKGGGFADERHLWPAWFHLVRVCRPGVVFGEQVASRDGLAWLDLVQADLEGEGYACGAADLCAAGVGAPHIRQRLYFVAERVADAEGGGRGQERADAEGKLVRDSAQGQLAGLGASGGSCLPSPTNGFWRAADWLGCRDGAWRPVEPGTLPLASGIPGRVGMLRGYGNAIVPQVAAEVVRVYMA